MSVIMKWHFLCLLDNGKYISYWVSLFALATRKLIAKLELTCRTFHSLGFFKQLFPYLPLSLYSCFTFDCVSDFISMVLNPPPMVSNHVKKRKK